MLSSIYLDTVLSIKQNHTLSPAWKGHYLMHLGILFHLWKLHYEDNRITRLTNIHTSLTSLIAGPGSTLPYRDNHPG